MTLIDRLQQRAQRKAAARNGERGMTLIEIMVVITILGLIASAIGVAVLGQLHKAKVQAAKTQIADFGQALDLYKIDNGRYPTTAEGFGVLVSSRAGGQDGYLRVLRPE